MSQFYPYLRSFGTQDKGTTTFTPPSMGVPFEYGTLPFSDEDGNPIQAPAAKFCAVAVGVLCLQGANVVGQLSMTAKRGGVTLFQFSVAFNVVNNITNGEIKVLTGAECSITNPGLPALTQFQNPVVAGTTVYGDASLPNYGGTLSDNGNGNSRNCVASSPWMALDFTQDITFEVAVTGFDGLLGPNGIPTPSGPSVKPTFQFYYPTAFNPIPTFAAYAQTPNSITSGLPGYQYAPGFGALPGYSSTLQPPIVERGAYYQIGTGWTKEPLPLVFTAGQIFSLELEDGPNDVWIYTKDADGAIGWRKIIVQGLGITTLGAVNMPDGSILMSRDGSNIRRLEEGQTTGTVIPTNLTALNRTRLVRQASNRVFIYGRNTSTSNFERFEVQL
jgi:hypothetical protein